jgi:hypothetical protein
LKKIISILLILKSSLIFSQNFNDKIITWKGDTIKCEITLINDYDFFYDKLINQKIKKDCISTLKVKNYILDKASNPDISITKKKDTSLTVAKYDSLRFAERNARNSILYKNGVAINIEALLVADFKLSFTHRIGDGLYLESMISYNIPLISDAVSYNNEFSFIELKDPYGLYGRFQVRAGLKNYTTKRFYVCPTLLYSYGSFYKKDNIIYESGKNYYEVTRYKNDFEFFFKFGWTFHPNDLLNDFYLGIGMRAKYLNDVIYKGSIGSGNYTPVASPINKHTSLAVLTFHLGYQIGFCK